MPKDNKTVHCIQHTPEGPISHWVDRTVCLLEMREGCPTCPHSRFVVRFQLRVVDQLVACPRWGSEGEERDRKDPVDYVTVQRDTCIRQRPYTFCQRCPNSSPSEEPRVERRWFEMEERQRRIELELDEEERDGR